MYYVHVLIINRLVGSFLSFLLCVCECVCTQACVCHPLSYFTCVCLKCIISCHYSLSLCVYTLSSSQCFKEIDYDTLCLYYCVFSSLVGLLSGLGVFLLFICDFTVIENLCPFMNTMFDFTNFCLFLSPSLSNDFLLPPPPLPLLPWPLLLLVLLG